MLVSASRRNGLPFALCQTGVLAETVRGCKVRRGGTPRPTRATRMLPGAPSHASSPTRGSVLIVVLWATLGLVSVALLFGHSMMMTYRGADNELAGRQAAQAIDGAARYAETLLKNAVTPGVLPEAAEYLSDTIPVGEATFYLLGRSQNPGSGTTRSFGLVDESGKIDMNADPAGGLGAVTALNQMLKLLPGMTAELADAIMDWQDADEDLSESGAEAETYSRFTPAYSCKNGPFESIEELALLNGATREVLYGEDTNLNGVLDDNENDGDASEPADNADGKLDLGILEYVTVFKRESNKHTDSTGASVPRIDITNIQQASQDLTTLIDEKLGSGRAARIIQLASGPPQSQPMKSVLEFYLRCKASPEVLSEDEFGQLIDGLTVGKGDYLSGLINVNTASEAVLACIPGIGDKAADVVSARLSRVTQDTNIAWVVEVVGDPGAQQAGPFLTGRSSQVTADIAAVGRNGRGYRREKVVIDQSTGTPRIVYRRNLAPLGWALGSEIREELAQLKEQAK